MRVEGRSNTSATLLPTSALRAEPVGLQLERPVEHGEQLVARKLLAGEEMPESSGQCMCDVLSWNLFHGRDFPPDRALLTWRSRLLG